MKNAYWVEMTDTFGGEANYCWVNRFKVYASSMLGAARKVAKHTGFNVRCTADFGDMRQYDARGACVRYFIECFDEERATSMPNHETL